MLEPARMAAGYGWSDPRRASQSRLRQEGRLLRLESDARW